MGYTPHVLVIGGGVVGTGIARDFAIRGFDVTLVERGTLAAGSTGRALGVLYSGARERANDRLANLLYRENRTLREIAGHCLEDTGGLLVTTDDTSLEFDDLRRELEEGPVPQEVLDEETLREMEPALATDVGRAIRVPEAVVDQFDLTIANARSAQEYGATIRTQTAVTDISVDGGTIGTVSIEHDPWSSTTGESSPSKGIQTDGGHPGESGKNMPGGSSGGSEATQPGGGKKRSQQLGEPTTDELDPDYVVNATSVWAGEVAALAGLTLDVPLTAGTTAVHYENPVERIVTRYDSDGEATVVPTGRTAQIGTLREEISRPEEGSASQEAGLELVERLNTVVPALAEGRTLRADCERRSWHPSAESEHRFTLVDHGDSDGCWGMTTVAGGSLTTHRFLAKWVVDDVCAKFGIKRSCQTDEIPLPSPGGSSGGSTGDESTDSPVVCECQSVTREVVQRALEDDTGESTSLEDVRIRTDAMTGECQGGRCAHRVAAELYPDYDDEVVTESLRAFLSTHWQGQRRALCGQQFEQIARTYVTQVETAVTGLDAELVPSKTDDVEEAMEDEERTVSTNAISLAVFDDGTEPGRRERPTWGERPL